MLRTPSVLLAGAVICATGLLAAGAQEPKKAERSEIPGGIEGHVKGVDREKQTLTIVVPSGAERTFTITDETTMLGPRGGRVRYRLRDRRFHEGMEVIVVANGAMAREVHLGYDRGAQGQPTGSPKPAAKGAPAARPGDEKAPTGKATKRAQREAVEAAAAKAKAGAREEEEDEDNEIPGTVKSYDPARRLLVVALLNGKSRSFLLSREVKVLVRGTPSTHGLSDPALKAGASVAVHVEPGGRRVREVHITPAPAASAKSKKAA
jgi:hypothetical protein